MTLFLYLDPIIKASSKLDIVVISETFKIVLEQKISLIDTLILNATL